jgi:hypothetical protein
MVDARLEPEVLAAKLHAWGCPYSAIDPRATVWLEGCQSGVKPGFRDAARALNLTLPSLEA